MTILGDIPKGWAVTSVGEVAKYQNGRAFKPSEWEKTGLPIIRIQNLNDTSAAFNFSDQPHEQRFKVNNGDLLFAWSASLGAYIWRGQKAWLNQHIFRVDHCSEIDRLFLYYALTNITSELYAKAHGSGMVHVTKAKFEETLLWLPPLNEQRRVVAKIEEIFSELDKGVESLKTARAQLKVYRQAVLKYAFEGKLTVQWREENKDKLETAEKLLDRIRRERDELYEQRLKGWKTALQKWEESGKLGKKPARPRKTKPFSTLDVEKLSHSGALPSGWLWLTAESVGTVQLGRQRSPKNRSKYFPTKYIRAANITEHGLALDDILDMDFLPHELSAYRLKKGDLLLAEASGSSAQVGKPAIWADQIPNCCFQNTVIRHQPYCRHFAVFLLWLYRYFYLSGKFAQVAGGVGINHLSASRFAQIPLPLCSVAEQLEIVSLLEERFAAIERAEREVDSSLRRTETLRQAVLKKAFSGQLVAQESNDETSSTLLERIKAEKASQKSRAKTRKRKVAST